LGSKTYSIDARVQPPQREKSSASSAIAKVASMCSPKSARL
jgi:hypothetical protein